jgi:hypothetical protein
MELYYYQDGEYRGPVNAAQLRELARIGVIGPETYIRRGDKKTRARNVNGLEFPSLPPEIPASDPEAAPAKSRTVFLPGGGVREVEVKEEPEPVPESVLSAPAAFLLEASAGILTAGSVFRFIGAVTFVVCIGGVLSCLGGGDAVAVAAWVLGVAAGLSLMLTSLVFRLLGALGRFFAVERPHNRA